MKVYVHGPNLNDQRKGTFHVHTAECGDNRHYGPEGKFGGERDAMPIDAEDSDDVIVYVYADQIAEQPEIEREDYINMLFSDFWFAPCIPKEF